MAAGSARQRFLADMKTATGRAVRTVKSRPPVGQIIHYAPTGMDTVDQYLLGGGFPCGRITEIAGDEGVGKSSLLFATIAECQSIGWNTLLYETESRLDSRRLEMFGINLGELILEEPLHLEALITHLYGALAASKKSKVPMLIGWDSIAATCTKMEWEKGVKAGPEGAMQRAGQLSQQLRILDRKVAESNCALVCTNQLRTKIGDTFGDPMESVGGLALKYAATFRLRFRGGEKLKRGSEIIGRAPILSTEKSHGVPPFRKVRVFLVFNEGWAVDRTLLQWARDRGIVSDSDQVSRARMEFIRKVAAEANWEPSLIPKVMARLELAGEVPKDDESESEGEGEGESESESESESASETAETPTPTEATKKKAAKKKAAKKKTAKKQTKSKDT